MTTGRELANRETGEIIELEPQALAVSPAYVQETTKSIALLQDMTKSLLKRGRDFGRTPGTASDGLWDPGASLIIAGFNCYVGQRRVLRLVDEEIKISVIVEVPIISRQSGKEVGTGVGAASTLETKYKYRWLYPSELEQLGYTKEQITSLKTDQKHKGRYRVDNPEHGELLNTLIKQASKRAEVDAAEALPGVASVLREMFDPNKQEGAGEQPPRAEKTTKNGKEEYEGPAWQRFFGDITRLGYTNQEAKDKLGVTSWHKDWLAKGHSLQEATDILGGKKQPAAATEEEPTEPVPDEADQEDAGAVAPVGEEKPAGAAAPVKPEPIISKPSKQPVCQTWADLALAASKLGVMPSEVFKRSGYKKWEDFPSFRDAWGIVEEVVNEKPQKPK